MPDSQPIPVPIPLRLAPEPWNYATGFEFRKRQTGTGICYLLPARTMLADVIDAVIFLLDVDENTDESAVVLQAAELRNVAMAVRSFSERIPVAVASSTSPEMVARRTLHKHKELEAIECVQLIADSVSNKEIETTICATLVAMRRQTDAARDTLTRVKPNMTVMRTSSNRLVALRQQSMRQLVVKAGRSRRISSLRGPSSTPDGRSGRASSLVRFIAKLKLPNFRELRPRRPTIGSKKVGDFGFFLEPAWRAFGAIEHRTIS